MYEINFSGVFKHLMCLKLTSYYLGKQVLDLGCGDGMITRVLANMSDGSEIFAYDGKETCSHFSETFLRTAAMNTKRTPNVRVIDHLNGDRFDTVVLMCVLHENKSLLSYARHFTKQSGRVVVFDHDKKHMSFEEFRDSITMQDRREIEKRGFDAVYKEHTAMGIEECVANASFTGLRTTECFSHKDFGGHPFYLWVGRPN